LLGPQEPSGESTTLLLAGGAEEDEEAALDDDWEELVTSVDESRLLEIVEVPGAVEDVDALEVLGVAETVEVLVELSVVEDFEEELGIVELDGSVRTVVLYQFCTGSPKHSPTGTMSQVNENRNREGYTIYSPDDKPRVLS
jgi:hypothetical protein